MKVTALCNKYLQQSDNLDDRSFERIHRIGPVVKGRNRVIIARLTHFKDRSNILKTRMQLKTLEGIGISEDYSPEVELERKRLYPVMLAIKEKLRGNEKENVYLKEDQLTVKGKGYSVKTLDSLPEDMSVHKLFTPSQNNITAFFTRNSVFSNHHPCMFVVDGISYSSMEKFLFCTKAEMFADEELKKSIEKEEDPVEIKRLGKKIKNFDKVIWDTRIEGILRKGLMQKFGQNPKLQKELCATGDSEIVEANQHDCVYGVGLALRDNKIWDPEEWKGKNLMGKALMDVRKLLKTGK